MTIDNLFDEALLSPEEGQIRIAVTVDGKLLLQLPVEDGQVVAVLSLHDAILFLEHYVNCLKLIFEINMMPIGIDISAMSPGGTA